MKFNVGKCSVMHIGYNNINGNYASSTQQLPALTESFSPKTASGSSKQRKAAKLPLKYSDSLPASFKYKN